MRYEAIGMSFTSYPPPLTPRYKEDEDSSRGDERYEMAVIRRRLRWQRRENGASLLWQALPRGSRRPFTLYDVLYCAIEASQNKVRCQQRGKYDVMMAALLITCYRAPPPPREARCPLPACAAARVRSKARPGPFPPDRSRRPLPRAVTDMFSPG